MRGARAALVNIKVVQEASSPDHCVGWPSMEDCASMSAATEQALSEFNVAIQDPENLLLIHREINKNPGRRWREPTLNRAIVVLTVAAWQAFVQDLVLALLENLVLQKGEPGWALYKLVDGSTKSALGRFNTADSQRSLDLMLNVGFDPVSAWTFTIGSPQRSYSPDTVRKEIDGWLAIRHKIAHGASLPESELVSGRPKSGPSLYRKDAERCVEFFRVVTGRTADRAHGQYP